MNHIRLLPMSLIFAMTVASPAAAGPITDMIHPVPPIDVGEVVHFVGSVTDPDGLGDIASIDWDFNYDGTTFEPDLSAIGDLTPVHVFVQPGMYNVALKVTDVAGDSALDQIVVTVQAVSEPTTLLTILIGRSLSAAFFHRGQAPASARFR